MVVRITSAAFSGVATGAGVFLRANKRAADAVEARLPHAKTNLHDEYAHAVAQYMNSLPRGAVVVDVGGGKKCAFARYRNPTSGVRLVAVDISAEELAYNVDVDEKLVADVTERLPFGDHEVDMLVSSSVIEHLRNSEAFVRESARVLKPRGLFVHVLPNKFAPFSVANQLIPQRIAQRLLRVLVPGSEGVLGFPAFYDRTYPAAFRQLVARCGLNVRELRVAYYQAYYFDFFIPLYIINVAYELVVSSLRLENLAANMLIVAQKP
jgi:ubiquinone/menaquinone biosynthesis C-methylase UbiE